MTKPLDHPGARALLPVALAFAFAASLAACKSEPVGERDREVLVRVGDLAAHGIGFDDAARYEKFEKSRYFDGSCELTYEFELPDAEVRPGAVYMRVAATVETDKQSATVAHGAEKVGFNVGMKFEGFEAEERKDFFRHGDDSSFFLLTKGGQPVGNFFVTRHGKRVYSIIVAGIYFDDPSAWSELISPKLEKFAAYNP